MDETLAAAAAATPALLPLLDLPTFEPSPNAHARIDVSRLDTREVERRDPCGGCTLCVLRLHVFTDGGGVEFVCRGEERAERRLRASVEVRKGRRSSTLDRSIGGQGHS